MLLLQKKSLIIFLTLVLDVSARKFDDYEDSVERGNAFVDQILHDMVLENGEDYDPYHVENSTIGFHRKIIVNISGEATLYDGYLRGLKSLHRADNCYLTEEGDRLLIRADMGAGVLDFHYAGTVKFMTYGPIVEVLGKVPYVEVVMEMTVNSKDGRDGKLEKFYIEDIRGMQVWISGLGPLNWAVNSLISAITVIFRRFLYSAIENKVEGHIAERIQNYKFPVDNIDEGTTVEIEETTVEFKTSSEVEETTPEIETTAEVEETTAEIETTAEVEETTAEVEETTAEVEETTTEIEETTPEVEETNTKVEETTLETENRQN